MIEYERLLKIATKMHLWIFLHSGDEQKVYDELGLTDEENCELGYSGQFVLREEEVEEEEIETDCDYQRAIDQLEHDILYEPTFNPDDGSM